jgi:hypothetical protein
MQCPLCNAEIGSSSSVCDHCGAIRVYARTTAGVMVGWFGMVMVLLWAIMALPLVVFPFIHYSLAGYPWLALVIGAAITAGLLWYSKSTVHAEWVRR